MYIRMYIKLKKKKIKKQIIKLNQTTHGVKCHA